MTKRRHRLAATPASASGPSVKAQAAAPAPRPARPRSSSRTLNLSYGDNHVLHDITMDIAGAAGHGLHRPLGLRQVDAAALPQPDERPDRRRAHHRVASRCKGLDINAPDDRRDRGAAPDRAWCSRSRTPSPSRSTRTWSTACASPASTTRRSLDEACERSLTGAALWDEVKDRLHESGLGLSGGQQQRLCIARAIAVEPEIILMDEPCSALDPIATLKIEELIYSLKEQYTIVIVTHNLQQAARVSDQTAFFWLGRLVEYGPHARHVHQAPGEADGGLHHGPVRLDRKRLGWNGIISKRSCRRSSTACSPWAPWSRSASTRPIQALIERRPEPAEQDHRRRPGGERPADRDRRPLPEAAGAAAADGHRPAAHHGGHEDQRRPGADRRPGGEHRGERPRAAAAAAAASR